jgi:hypothetical protein
MSTSRNGFVRSNSGGVYKGIEAGTSKKIEYDFTPRDSSCLVLVVGLLIVAGLAAFILTHI